MKVTRFDRDELGYSPRQGEAITVLRSAVGREEGYLIRVARFACLGFHIEQGRGGGSPAPVVRRGAR